MIGIRTQRIDARANRTTLRDTRGRYTYDAVGNRSRVVEADGNRVTWSYDSLYQLKREQRSGANSYDITYTYDPVRNRSTTLENAVTTTYAYDAANQLSTFKDNTGTTTYTYDADGNQRTEKIPAGGVTTYTWDFENRLELLAEPGGTSHTFAYNADGQRVEQRDATSTTKAIWDEENLLLETDGSDVTQAVYTLEPEVYGNQISQRRSGTTQYYHFDGLGSTDRLTNASETVTDTYKYKAFGIPLTSTGNTTNPFRYVGQLGYYQFPESSLYYVRARWLDSNAGRWLSRDPLGELIQYGYVENNPLTLVDPSGLQANQVDTTPKRRGDPHLDFYWVQDLFPGFPQALRDGAFGYQMKVYQRLRKRGGREPARAGVQTWQTNDMFYFFLGRTTGPCYWLWRKFPRLDVNNIGGLIPTITIEDTMGVRFKVENLNICIGIEQVSKKLGLSEPIEKPPGFVPTPLPVPRIQPYAPTPAQLATARGMHPPFLFAKTYYLYFNKCNCRMCFPWIPDWFWDLLPEIMETYQHDPVGYWWCRKSNKGIWTCGGSSRVFGRNDAAQSNVSILGR